MYIWRSLIRLKRMWLNSLSIFILVFLISLTVLSSLAVRKSIESTKNTILATFPPVIEIERGKNFDSKNFKNSFTSEKATQLFEKTKEYILVYDYIMRNTYTSKDLKPSNIISPSDSKFEAKTSSDHKTGEISIYAEGTQNKLPMYTSTEDAKLIDGRGFSNEELQSGEKKALISKQLAEANELVIGSSIKFSSVIYKYDSVGKIIDTIYLEKDVEVIGILEYKNVDEYVHKKKHNSSTNYSDAMQEWGNCFSTAQTIIMPNALVSSHIEEFSFENAKVNNDNNLKADPDWMSLVFPVYILKDAKYIDEFKENVNVVYSEVSYKINLSQDEYERLSKPLQQMDDLSNKVFVLSGIAGVLVLALVFQLFLLFRKKEIGILLALGERKRKIMAQLIAETVIVALFAILFSVIVSSFLSASIAEYARNELLGSNLNNDTVYNGTIRVNAITPEFIAEQYQGGFEASTIGLFSIVVTFIIGISQCTTLVYLLRMNPKKILLKNDK